MSDAQPGSLDLSARKAAMAAMAAMAAVDQILQISGTLGGQELEINTQYNANNHIMGNDKRDSVTNGECRAHDRPNLWLPGGATMPSASVVNTTLSTAALGLRATDSIQRFFA